MNAKPEWMLQNESASVALLSLLYSPQDDNLIVAAAVAARSQQLLKALKAQMEKSGNNTLFAVELRSSERLMLQGAGRGYVYVSQPMIRANAVGYVACFLHKAACDPRLVVSPEGPFYVVLGQTAPASQPFDIRDLFVETTEEAALALMERNVVPLEDEGGDGALRRFGHRRAGGRDRRRRRRRLRGRRARELIRQALEGQAVENMGEMTALFVTPEENQAVDILTPPPPRPPVLSKVEASPWPAPEPLLIDVEATAQLSLFDVIAQSAPKPQKRRRKKASMDVTALDFVENAIQAQMF